MELTPEQKTKILEKYPFYKEYVAGRLGRTTYLFNIDAFKRQLIADGLTEADLKNLAEEKVHFPTTKRLHTDVLEEQYGPIHAEVLRHDDKVREVHLADSKGISRTYALTFFFGQHIPEIKKIDNDIRAGKPIGKTFREYGYEVRKNVIDVYAIEIPKWLQDAFKEKSKYAKARLSEFYAKKNGDAPVIYGTVVEIYSPNFRPAIVNEADHSQINPSTESFEKIGISKEEVWKRIGSGNIWTDVPRYSQAREDSLKLVFKLKLEIREYLEHSK